MSMHSNWSALRSARQDRKITDHELAPGTLRRVLTYATAYRAQIIGFVITLVISAALVVAQPLLFLRIIDDGITPGDKGVVITSAILVVALAILDSAVTLLGRWYSSRIGEGLIYDLRTEVFDHVQRQPVAFFTRTQTGALVSRLNNDVIGAQQAFTSTLSGVVGNAVTLVAVVGAMLVLSWPITLGSLALVPLFLLPAQWMGRRLQGLARNQMNYNADLGTQMTERFNVAGAMLVKLFGRPAQESERFSDSAAQVRDTGVRIAMSNRVFFTALALVASFATAIVYGVGGVLTINGTLTIGTLLALAALLGRLYGPLTALSSVRVDVMTALVSFERVFEVLDLEPLIADAPDAVELSASGPLGVTFQDVRFRYPTADEVSLASLESIATSAERSTSGGWVLDGIDFTAAPGTMVALVGPSGAGKTTISALVARLYDVNEGAVRIGGEDVRAVTQQSLRAAIGVVTQDAHLFHDTIGGNLRYAAPHATDAELLEACADAQILDLLERLPDGLDTVVGDRGHRLSGGEKQRIALARLLLKAPRIVVLDEATAHLDSESEAAVQRALDTALAGRTSIVIAHRLSTVRAADQILVIDGGRVVERGRHDDLLAADGLYSALYRTQFAPQAAGYAPVR